MDYQINTCQTASCELVVDHALGIVETSSCACSSRTREWVATIPPGVDGASLQEWLEDREWMISGRGALNASLATLMSRAIDDGKIATHWSAQQWLALDPEVVRDALLEAASVREAAAEQVRVARSEGAIVDGDEMLIAMRDLGADRCRELQDQLWRLEPSERIFGGSEIKKELRSLERLSHGDL